MSRLTLAVGALLLASSLTSAQQLGQTTPDSTFPGNGNSISPPYNYIFDFPLPIPPTATPVVSTNYKGNTVQYFPVTIQSFQQKIYPNLPGYASLSGYNGTSPGPMIKVQTGTQSIIRVTNNGAVTAVTHLHGSETRAPWDGFASDLIYPGQFKDYYYPNAISARSLWYHDHADGHTSSDAYYGLNAAYIITDPAENKLNLPRGNYDVPLMLMDKIYDSNGNLVSPAGERVNWFGDIIHVNGQPWPYLNVEPRKYRFRILNAALSRPFSLYLSQDSNNAVQNFQVIASDGGLFSAPVTSSSLVIAMGERYEIVVDFSKFAGQTMTLRNAGSIPTIIDYQDTDKVMRFVVGKTVTDNSNNKVPNSLSNIQFPAVRNTIDRVFDFEHNQANWTINGVVFDDIAARVLARPVQGTEETWQLNYRSGPGVHPIHVHLVNFRINSRQGGRGAVQPYESAGMKDIALLAPGESVTITAVYGPWNGLYQFHCHNLIHEDHEMMDVFNVTASPLLQKLGYNNLLSYDDPMAPQWQAKNIDQKYYSIDYITNTLIPNLVDTGAHNNMAKIQKIFSTANAGPKINVAATPVGGQETQSMVLSTMLSLVTMPGTTFVGTFVDVLTEPGYALPTSTLDAATAPATNTATATAVARRSQVFAA